MMQAVRITRRSTRSFMAVAAGVLIFGTLAACGSGSSSGNGGGFTASPSSAVESSDVTSSSDLTVSGDHGHSPPTVSGRSGSSGSGHGPTASFVVPITDKDGYHFDVSVNLQGVDLGRTVEFDKPGFMSSYLTFGLTIDLINNTPGRSIAFQSVAGITAPLSDPTFLLLAMWNRGSPVCAGADTTDSTKAEACGMILGFGDATSPLAPGATQALDVKRGTPAGDRTSGLAGFPEGAWPKIQVALSKPDRFVVTYSGGDAERFGCHIMNWGVPPAVSTGALDCPQIDNLVMVRQPPSN